MFSSSGTGMWLNFDHTTQDWPTFKAKIEQAFIVNGTDDSSDKSGVKRRAYLLSALSDGTFQLATNLVLPGKLETKNYSDILEVLTAHFTPKRCGFAERHHFFAAKQEPNETPTQWAARLRGLAAHCSFQNMEEALLNKFAMGMAPGREREKVFALDVADVTLAKAIEVAETARAARVGAETAPGSGAGAVFKIGQTSSAKSGSGFVRSDNKPCSVCGRTNHDDSQCRFKKLKCGKCKVKGHLRKMCKVKYVEAGEVSEGDDGELYSIRSENCQPMSDIVTIKGSECRFEIDSGSAVTVISEQTYNKRFQKVALSQAKKRLVNYTGGSIDCVGVARLPVTYAGRTHELDVHVVRGGGPPLLGRDFISTFNLELSPVQYCSPSSTPVNQTMNDLLSEYSDVFTDKLGCFNKYKIKLPLKDGAKPVFIKARPVAFALRDKVDEEIDRLVALGILVPIDHSDYASPIVPVLKKNGTVRLCADYSQTVNKQLLIDTYPLPTAEEMFSRLANSEQYSKLDMSMAYNQLQLDDPENVTCINTHRGLFKFTRMVFGLSSAPSLFQRALSQVLAGIEGVQCFLDDILISAPNATEHMKRLKTVFQRLREAGLTLQKEKCSFFQDEISYLGYIINKSGLKKSPEKVRAIVEAPVPKNVSELQSFLGLVNYYRNFVPGASAMLCPLYNLLRKDVTWCWTNEHHKAFQEIKNSLASDKVLAHFDPSAKLILTVDASPRGLGAILSQIGADGIERPCSFVSRTLNPAEKNYSQIQKEATAIIFGVRRFHQFLYGRADPFVLRSDHKPLISIFGQRRGIPEVSANRLQRYAMFLSAYNYSIEYIKSSNNCADFLSRATLPETFETGLGKSEWQADASAGDRATYINFIMDSNLPITLKQLRDETDKDPVLSKVIKFVRDGWPRKVSDASLKPYFLCRLQLDYENGCLLRGHKVIIPSSLQNKILSLIHSTHLGIVKSKAEIRGRFWFPGVDKAVEQLIANCKVCLQLRPSPPRAPLAPWTFPPRPFYRIHCDLLGPINSRMYLVIVDAYSKWVECYDMKNNTTSIMIISKLYEFMSRFGVPDTIVSDNGTCFTSNEFRKFCLSNGISHVTSAIYTPSCNGQVEVFVKITKRGIKEAIMTCKTQLEIDNKIQKYLFDYRNSIHSTTGSSPAQLVFGRQLRSVLDILNPRERSPSSTELADHVKQKQSSQVKNYGGVERGAFEPGGHVMFKRYINKDRFVWTKGIIVKPLGKVLFLISLFEDRTAEVVRHKNQIYKCKHQELSKTIGETKGTAGKRLINLTMPVYSRSFSPEAPTASGGERDGAVSQEPRHVIEASEPPLPAAGSPEPPPPAAGSPEPPPPTASPGEPLPPAASLSEPLPPAAVEPDPGSALEGPQVSTPRRILRNRPKVDFKHFR